MLDAPVAIAEPGEALTVRLEEGQTLRDVAEEHLGDPDLWTEILRANGLSVTDVRPGLELTVPVGPIADAGRALAEALDLIQRATAEGARLFAPTLIGQAIQLRDSALAQRKAGDWEGAAELADNARLTAERALEAALKQRDAAAEALLSDRDGWVEGQRPQDLVWSDRPLNTVLIEEEKVRTLSRSTAQITFRDDSRLRLNANSQAVIQRMRVDPLSRTEEAKVSLVAGDVYALLAGQSQRKRFALEVPEVETRIESTNFWARHDASGSKFANYDERTLEVSARGESVALGRNEGTLVRRGEAPSDKIAVLPPPALLAPPDDAVAFNADIDLRWSPVTDAPGYWLELAADPAFDRMTLTRWGLQDPDVRLDELDVGSYYWRVAALDKFGLPGAWSDVRRLNVRTDTVPPFVAIAAPEEGAIVRRGPVRVAGTSEPGTALILQDSGPVTVGPDGAFEASYDPRPGVNEVVVEARDRAGNVTRRSRSFVFMPDERAAAVFDRNIPRLGPRHFVTERDVISLAGTAAPNARVHVRAAAGTDGAPRASAYTDAEGRFRINVPLRAETEEFDLQIVMPSGFATGEGFTVSVDERPPAIELDEPPPAVTAVEWLPLRGRTAGATGLLLNGRPVPTIGDGFDETVTLHQGANEIEMVATDLVGNVRVERWQVVLDQEPPELVRQSLSRERVAAGEPVTVEVVASDPSGLKKAAPFTVEIGATTYADFLELDQPGGRYRATVIPPRGAEGRVRLADVELEDYAGNKRRYTFK